MGTTTKQYRPMADTRADANAGLDLAAVRDLADAINNYAKHTAPRKIFGWPCIPQWDSPDPASGTREETYHVFCPREIPDGYTHLALALGHNRTVGAGSVTWRLYSNEYIYYGPLTLDTTYLSPNYKSGSIVSNNGTHAVTVVRSIEIIRKIGASALILTAENSDTTTRSRLTSVDIWAYRSA